jgi:hypothetical protein
MKDIFDVASKAGAVLTVTALTISVAFEAGYFFFIDIQFLNTTSVTDYLTRALILLPFLVVLPGLVFGFYKVAAFISPRQKSVGETVTAIIVLGVAIPGLLIWGMFSGRRDEGVILFGLFVLSFYFPGAFLMIVAVSGGFSVKVLVPTLVLSLLVALCFLGLSLAESELSAPPNYRIAVHGQSSPEEVRLLRNLQRGLLIRRPNERAVEFIPWDEVHSIKQLERSR